MGLIEQIFFYGKAALAYVLRFAYSLLKCLKSKLSSEPTLFLNCFDDYVKTKALDQTMRDELLSKMRTQLEAQVHFKLLNLDSQSSCVTPDFTVIS